VGQRKYGPHTMCFRIHFDRIPTLEAARHFAADWLFPGRAIGNEQYFQWVVTFAPALSEEMQMLLRSFLILRCFSEATESRKPHPGSATGARSPGKQTRRRLRQGRNCDRLGNGRRHLLEQRERSCRG